MIVTVEMYESQSDAVVDLYFFRHVRSAEFPRSRDGWRPSSDRWHAWAIRGHFLSMRTDGSTTSWQSDL